jgi:hypothetical protein
VIERRQIGSDPRMQEVEDLVGLQLAPPKPALVTRELWPPEVNLILSAMDAAPKPDHHQGRREQRLQYRVRAELKLHADAPDSAPWVLYTRDVDPRGLGFITPDRLPLGYGGWIELFTPRGRKARIDCTIYRCRQVIPEWFEGALYFNREQWMFAAEH